MHGEAHVATALDAGHGCEPLKGFVLVYLHTEPASRFDYSGEVFRRGMRVRMFVIVGHFDYLSRGYVVVGAQEACDERVDRVTLRRTRVLYHS
jgi:hypothetical protein